LYGIIATLLAGRGSLLTPVAAPIALLPVNNVPDAGVAYRKLGIAMSCGAKRGGYAVAGCCPLIPASPRGVHPWAIR
jgi:hypothetical protein